MVGQLSHFASVCTLEQTDGFNNVAENGGFCYVYGSNYDDPFQFECNRCRIGYNRNNAIFLEGARMNGTNCFFYKNTGDGAAVFATTYAELTLANCTLADNLGDALYFQTTWGTYWTGGLTPIPIDYPKPTESYLIQQHIRE